ncbi:hypothetical protein ACFSSA_13585 [Luteolibacter algae]|uniref:AbrB/MazE/SpoVT family DNA-binding domain-containing protein n=1 Tax=Luteolibacter algae TaxID=454151 RepID=A0ABW5DEA5_9BACT
MDQTTHQIRPDAKGRINLGKLAEGISSFRAHRTEEGNIVLEPYSEIPTREKWLFDNPQALEAVKVGLAQAASGETSSLGSFAEHADEDID